MCAIGKNDTIEPPPLGQWLTSSRPRHCASSLPCVSWTPFGGPVVPDV